MSQPFELVNLAASAADNSNNPVTHESSDDGLDPYEFISHEDAKRDKTKKKSISPDKTPTLLNSDLINSSTYLAETISASKLIEPLNSLGSLQFQSMFQQDDSKELPQVHLQGTNEMLQRQLRDLIRKHERLLSDGANCASARQSIGQLLNQLSENNVRLYEVYSSELEFTNQFSKKLIKWNSKRTSVLKKIKLIKSADNKYGTKLQGLLDQRREVDDEVEALQKRMQVLSSKKAILNSEIGETISVLESRSAKYVSLFRNLEKQGKEAVLNYLAQETSPDTNLRSLIKTIPVDSGFNSLTAVKDYSEVTPPIQPTLILVENPNDPYKSNEKKYAQVGMIPYDFPVSAPSSLSQIPTPYEKGFSSGAEQVERVKEGIATLVNHLFMKDTSSAKQNTRLDDEHNIITEMMDLEPIIQLLKSKSEAMEVFLKNTSRLSESYHKDSILWADLCFILEVNEDKAYEEISKSGDPVSIIATLQDSFEYLKKAAGYRVSNGAIRADNQDRYISAVLKNEWNTVAVALDKILQTSEYTSQLENLSSLDPEAHSIDNKYLLHSRITSTGNDEVELGDQVDDQPRNEHVTKSSFSLNFKKGVKKE